MTTYAYLQVERKRNIEQFFDLSGDSEEQFSDNKQIPKIKRFDPQKEQEEEETTVPAEIEWNDRDFESAFL